MTSFYDKTTESAKHTISSLNTKIKESTIGDDIKKMGTKFADKSKEYGVVYDLSSRDLKSFP